MIASSWKVKQMAETFANQAKLFSLLSSNSEGIARPMEAKWHVRVSKQSCKQANGLILWGVGGEPQKKNLDFYYFFFPKKLEKYDLTRPKMSKYSLTSSPEVIIVFHGEYKRTVTDTLKLSHCRAARTTASASHRVEMRNSLELTSIATGALVSSVPAEGSHS